jgi:hypothetical protein
MFFFRGEDKWYLYRAVDEHGQVVDVLLREHRDTASAEAFFEQALGRSGRRVDGATAGSQPRDRGEGAPKPRRLRAAATVLRACLQHRRSTPRQVLPPDSG